MANKFEKQFNKKNHAGENVSQTAQTIQVGAGLLSQASIQQAKEMQLIFVKPSEIDKAQENQGISIERIEELAASIADVGLINPLVLRLKEDGRYKIVAGERRYTAIEKLIEENKWAPERTIKGSLFDPDLIDLPLSDEDKEEYIRVTENAEQREQTDGDKLLLMRKLKVLYEKLRAEGLYRGVDTRELLSADMKIGKSTVAQFQKVENQGSDKLKQAMIDGNVNITAAVEIASMEQESQDDLINQVLDSGKQEITKKDIKKYQYEQRHDLHQGETTPEQVEETMPGQADSYPEEQPHVEPDMTLVTEKSLKKEMRSIYQCLKDNDGIYIHKDDLLTILNKIRDIDKIIGKYKN